ncbi:transglycosylase [Bacillus cereus]|nr:transglycosylase [Bacillus cereus]PGU70474.1 transglycosylase [Bacillus cereus]
MKNVKFFLVSYLALHIISFPLQSQAEENNMQVQKISEINKQEEQSKEMKENSEQEEMKQTEDKKKLVENEKEQIEERKIETARGIITVNKRELTVGEEIRIAVEPSEKNIQSIKGILQLQNNGEQYAQERILSFEYEEETGQWVANYKVGLYDLQGEWNLQLIQSYKEDGKEEVKENEVKVPLVRIRNETPIIDKELPKLEKISIDEAKGTTIERKKGDSIHIRVKTLDVESVVNEVRVILKGKDEANSITCLLDYIKDNMDWQKTFKLTEEIPVGTYQLIVEVIDAAGNKLVTESEYIISIIEQKEKDDEKVEEQENQNEVEEKKETEEQENSKIGTPFPEEKLPVVHIQKQDEKVNYVIENKEVNNVKAHKVKQSDKDNQVVSKKKEKIEGGKEKKEQEGEQGIQSSNVFAIMSGLFVLFLVLKGNKEWG